VFLEQKYGIDIFIHGEGEDGQTFVLEKILSQSGGEKDSSVVLHKIQQQILIHCIIGREMKGNLQFFVKLFAFVVHNRVGAGSDEFIVGEPFGVEYRPLSIWILSVDHNLEFFLVQNFVMECLGN